MMPEDDRAALGVALRQALPDEAILFAQSALIDADRAVELAEGGTIQVQAAALSARAMVKATIAAAMA